MIIYNVTYSVDKEIAEEWVSWMKDHQMPDALKTGLIINCEMWKVLTHEDNHTFSYAIQYYSNSLHDVEKYVTKDDEMEKRYGDRVVGFPTLLERV